ncbi:MAG: class I SAM-dependent methyltransferase [bacterium]|nr:class I SAM-dependent methyltransferase [bacterium]
MKSRNIEWYNEEYSRLQESGSSWSTPQMYENKLECLNWCCESVGILKTVSILDVGCGAGELAKLLFRNGYSNVDGIDISEVAIKHAVRIHNSTFLSKDFSCPVKLEKEYDCIYDTDCLHMVVGHQARKAFLENVKLNLSENGVFLTGINSSRKDVDPYVVLDGVAQYFWPQKEQYIEEICKAGLHNDSIARYAAKKQEKM